MTIYTAAPATAGVVLSTSGRQQGEVSVAPGALRVGTATIPWADVLLAVNQSPSAAAPAPNMLRLKNGEAWAGTVTLVGGRLTFDSPLLGQRTVDLAKVRAIDFAPGLPWTGTEKGGVLYRNVARDVPGTLVWMRDDRVGINTVVGAVALKRSELKRYVFAGPANATNDADDELTLSDGSVLRGRIEAGEKGLTLKHATLGERLIPPQAWWTIRRGADASRSISLTELKPQSVKTYPLIRRPASPPRAERATLGGPADFATRLRIWPRTVVVYRLPGPPTQKYLLTAVLRLDEVSRGEARVRVQSGDSVNGKSANSKTLLDKILTPEQPPLPLSIEAAGGSELTIEVDFGDAVRFPCNVVMDDGLLLRK
ncbi:MAG: hypothetical protein K8T25_10645 [Planctomycetia bacterium]|nr:hypothetical protein [Planctomycetia bacterium]